MQRFVIICLFSCVIGFDFEQDKIQTNEFFVKPGGQVGEFERDWLGYKCKFTYQSQGGTKEQWTMNLMASKDGSNFACAVERPGHESYLFFQTFKLEVSGGKAVEAAAHGEKQKPLPAAEFKFDEAKGTVADVPGKFGNHLTRVALHVVKGKQEL